MPATLINITNISPQVVPILYGATTLGSRNTDSEVSYSEAGQLLIAPGSSVELEESRVDTTQLDRLRNLKLVSYTTR